MSFPKILMIFAGVLFSVIAIAALLKGDKNPPLAIEEEKAPYEIQLDREIENVTASIQQPTAEVQETPSPSAEEQKESMPSIEVAQEMTSSSSTVPIVVKPELPLPEADRINELFSKGEKKLPIVKTISYKSRVPWLKGRPAWLSDYAQHYSTSRHFIARSLNGKADYLKQDVSEGDRFNVLDPDKKISFYLLIDTSRSKLWFYYLDGTSNERVLLKTYNVGLGRIDSTKPSGMLTPLGKYSLGEKVAIYKPKTMGVYNGKKIEMVRVFGSRWIPFEKEIVGCTAPAAGFGLHGAPWISNSKGELAEDKASIGKYESDGCVRLSTEDMEELFSIIITRPATIELVKDFHEAKLPGVE